MHQRCQALRFVLTETWCSHGRYQLPTHPVQPVHSLARCEIIPAAIPITWACQHARIAIWSPAVPVSMSCVAINPASNLYIGNIFIRCRAGAGPSKGAAAEHLSREAGGGCQSRGPYRCRAICTALRPHWDAGALVAAAAAAEYAACMTCNILESYSCHTSGCPKVM